MTNCLVKTIVLYVIITIMMLIIKPQSFYYDTEKTKLKPWNLYQDTKSIDDVLTLYSSILSISIISFIIVNNI
jgi:hypothetical protein